MTRNCASCKQKQNGSQRKNSVERDWSKSLSSKTNHGCFRSPVELPLPSYRYPFILALLVAFGAGADEMFVLFAITVSLIACLYGGATGMLIRRFGILKALAIPVIPYVLSIVLFAFAIIGRPVDWKVDVIAMFVVPPVVFTWLVFWLHSLWARKQRLREVGLIP